MSTTFFEEYLWEPLVKKDFKTTLDRVAKRLDETRCADAIHIGGLALVGAGKIEDGIRWLDASVSLVKAAPEWFTNAVDALARVKRYQDASRFVASGLSIHPNHMRLNYLKAVMLSYMNKNAEALAALERLSKIYPNSPEIALTRGYTYHMMSKFQDALDTYSTISGITPVQQEELDNNISGVYMDMCNYGDSLGVLHDNYPNTTNPTTIYNQSLVELGLGMWPLAWQHHLARPCLGIPKHIKRPNRLIDLHNKDLFYFAEQGFGDAMQFVRYAPMLHKHCDRLTIGAPATLVRLFNTIPDERQFDILPSGGTLGRFDVALPFLDAPALFETNVDTIPAQIPYFRIPNVPPPWQRKDARPHIGLVWYGASRLEDPKAYSVNTRRSMSWETIVPLVEAFSDHVVFVNLQMEDTVRPGLTNVLQPQFDMFDTALVLNQLDLVITVDSALCHLAGAIGKPVWMLSRFDSCWRWFWDDRKTSPWYPTMRIFRQRSHFSWPDVVSRVMEELATLYP